MAFCVTELWRVVVLVELGVVEQRYAAVLEVIRDGSTVTEVAGRYGVTRQTVHRWLRQYAAKGLVGLVDQSTKPDSCPHQMPAVVEARMVELRRSNPGWGRGRCCSGWRLRGWFRCRAGPRCIGL